MQSYPLSAFVLDSRPYMTIMSLLKNFTSCWMTMKKVGKKECLLKCLQVVETTCSIMDGYKL